MEHRPIRRHARPPDGPLSIPASCDTGAGERSNRKSDLLFPDRLPSHGLDVVRKTVIRRALEYRPVWRLGITGLSLLCARSTLEKVAFGRRRPGRGEVRRKYGRGL